MAWDLRSKLYKALRSVYRAWYIALAEGWWCILSRSKLREALYAVLYGIQCIRLAKDSRYRELRERLWCGK